MRIVYICDCCEEVIAERSESEFDTSDVTLTSSEDTHIIERALDSHQAIIKCLCDDCRQSLCLSGDPCIVVNREPN